MKVYGSGSTSWFNSKDVTVSDEYKNNHEFTPIDRRVGGLGRQIFDKMEEDSDIGEVDKIKGSLDDLDSLFEGLDLTKDLDQISFEAWQFRNELLEKQSLKILKKYENKNVKIVMEEPSCEPDVVSLKKMAPIRDLSPFTDLTTETSSKSNQKVLLEVPERRFDRFRRLLGLSAKKN